MLLISAKCQGLTPVVGPDEEGPRLELRRKISEGALRSCRLLRSAPPGPWPAGRALGGSPPLGLAHWGSARSALHVYGVPSSSLLPLVISPA